MYISGNGQEDDQRVRMLCELVKESVKRLVHGPHGLVSSEDINTFGRTLETQFHHFGSQLIDTLALVLSERQYKLTACNPHLANGNAREPLG